DHEFAYWNREVEAPAKVLKAGKNVIAAYVRNHQGSSDIYLDVEVTAQVPLPPAPKKPKPDKPDAGGTKPTDPPKEEKPGTITVDKKARSVTIDCAVAARKLPNLNEIYPIEVVACYPHPKG